MTFLGGQLAGSCLSRVITRQLAPILTSLVLAMACGGNDSEEPVKDEATSVATDSPEATEGASTPTPTPTLPPVTDNRIRIPVIDVDAPLTFKPVSPQGQLPNPDGPDDATLYDFGDSFPDFGGLPGAGNAVLFGNPDSGSQSCKDGTEPPPCEGVFWNLNRVTTGDQVAVDWDGERFLYNVVSLCSIPRTEQFDEIYMTNDTPTLTLVTAGGDFDFDNLRYSHIIFVRAEAEEGAIEPSCPDGSTRPPIPGPTSTPVPPAEVSITSLAEAVRIGDRLHVEATSSTGAQCFLRIYSPEGVAEFGAIRQVEDASGLLIVDWLIRDKVTPGNKRFEIDCGGEVDFRDLLVTQ